MMTHRVKHMVSKKKRRYIRDGFDLDLTYICDNILAMGFPAEKLEALYRNDINDVSRFLESKHGPRYKVYNLCSERAYDAKQFNGRVATYGFDDHNPPKFELIETFCKDVSQWLGESKGNIAAVHCKAGKGRTGVMICCYLLHSKRFDSAAAVLDFYGRARTRNGQGVTIKSQQRYVGYYSDLLRFEVQYSPTMLLLQTVEVDGLALQSPVFLSVYQKKVKTYELQGAATGDLSKLVFGMNGPMPVSGDIKLVLTTKKHRMHAKEKVFHLWFNTFFMQFGYDLKRDEPEQAAQATSSRCITAVDDEQDENGNDPEEDNEIIASFWKSDLDECKKAEGVFSSEFRVRLVLSTLRAISE